MVLVNFHTPMDSPMDHNENKIQKKKLKTASVLYYLEIQPNLWMKLAI